MITQRVVKALEFDKVLKIASEFCVLYETKQKFENFIPDGDFSDAQLLLDKTSEAYDLLFNHGASSIEFYDDMGDILERVKKGATLSMGELLRCARLLKSGRILYTSVGDSKADAPYIKQETSGIYVDLYLENEIREKILSEDTMSDNASEKLCSLRKSIKRINEQIREKLLSFIRSGNNKYLQENIITMRGDRYVLPVKSEYRGQIGGFVHDQSSTGSTVFIEPTAVLELNNALKTATIEEQLEVERILSELSQKVSVIASKLETNEEIIVDVDGFYARAIYAYKTRSHRPKISRTGKMVIVNGRHPLIDKNKVVPLTLSFGDKYNYLLITGPNTGGKTVTLKLTGLFALMTMSGFFVTASEGTEISYFANVFCDVGDEQSIEQNLSTFSSHIRNIIEITNNVDSESLVLIDEIGAGTDPEEGSAIARAVIEKLLEKNSFGIITTHYSALKEYAYTDDRILNASMEFDPETFAPLYKINLGIPGSSNAIEISSMLGLDKSIIDRAFSLLKGEKVSFENVLKEAEKSRREAEDIKEELEKIKEDESLKLKEIETERNKLNEEKEKFYQKAKSESRRIVNEKLDEADEIIDEIKILFDKAELDSGDLIKARTLRNKLEDKKYSLEDVEEKIVNYSPVNPETLKIGDKVYYKPTETLCEVASINLKKKECEVFMGAIRLKAKISDLFFVSHKSVPKTSVALKREAVRPVTEINVIGESVMEALPEVEQFIDQAVINNLEEVKIIHGKGLKILSTAIHDALKRNKNVESFRFGKYGEGERGVTFVKLK
ncbi:MAG: endonuclease MutS2 [Clostridiales bacterium]|nr:endonuclease MutS2 [Clostridiales bacterium]